MSDPNQLDQFHYLDSSIVLAYLLEERDDIKMLNGTRDVASSRLLWTEVSRAVHCALQTQRLTANEATRVRRTFQELAAGISQITLGESVLQRADGPYPIIMHTLDAIHLASAEIWLRQHDSVLSWTAMSIWSLDDRMNQCAAQLGFSTPLLRE